MGLLPRLKSDKKFPAEGLDILTEMIRRELLNVSVAITDPSISFHCPANDRQTRAAGSGGVTAGSLGKKDLLARA
jgi:hypothetical protein